MSRKLGRKKAHRSAMLKNLVTSVILYEKVTTTLAKAKETKPIIEKVINIGKKQNLQSFRRLQSLLSDEKACKKVVEKLSLRFAKKTGGYSRVIRIDNRLGDAAQTAIIQLIPSENEALAKEISQVKDAKK